MINRIISFYKKELGLRSLVYKPNRVGVYLWCFKIFVFIVSLLSSFYFWFFNKNIIYVIVNVIFALSVSILLHHFYAKPKLKEIFDSLLEDKNYKEIIKKYKLEHLKEIRNSGLYEIRFLKLINYLEDKSWLNVKAIKKLVELTEKESSNRNFSNVYPFGLFLSLFIPVWNQNIKLIYDQIKSSEEKVYELIIGALLVMIVLGVVIFAIMALLKAIEEMINFEINKINHLKSILEDIELEILKLN